MTVKIGHARSDENNKARGGRAGDQTARELVVQDWYNRTESWTAVFRAKDSKIAGKIAKAMEQACINDNIGYDQGQRTTLHDKARALKWDLSKIKDKCECDCSSLVAVCVNAAGIKVSKDMYTGNQKAVLTATGKFEILTDAKYLIKSDFLKRGDILLGPGHTAIVLSDDTVAINIDSAKSFNSSFTGTYNVVTNKLNVRLGASVLKKVIAVISKGTKVKCFGYYTRSLGADWLYVQFTHNNTKYTGFVSAKYVVKCD